MTLSRTRLKIRKIVFKKSFLIDKSICTWTRARARTHIHTVLPLGDKYGISEQIQPE